MKGGQFYMTSFKDYLPAFNSPSPNVEFYLPIILVADLNRVPNSFMANDSTSSFHDLETNITGQAYNHITNM